MNVARLQRTKRINNGRTPTTSSLAMKLTESGWYVLTKFLIFSAKPFWLSVGFGTNNGNNTFKPYSNAWNNEKIAYGIRRTII